MLPVINNLSNFTAVFWLKGCRVTYTCQLLFVIYHLNINIFLKLYNYLYNIANTWLSHSKSIEENINYSTYISACNGL